MADPNSAVLQQILDQLQSLSAGQKALSSAHQELEKKLDSLHLTSSNTPSHPASPYPSSSITLTGPGTSYPYSGLISPGSGSGSNANGTLSAHRSSSSPSGGVDALHEAVARRLSSSASNGLAGLGYAGGVGVGVGGQAKSVQVGFSTPPTGSGAGSGSGSTTTSIQEGEALPMVPGLAGMELEPSPMILNSQQQHQQQQQGLKSLTPLSTGSASVSASGGKDSPVTSNGEKEQLSGTLTPRGSTMFSRKVVLTTYPTQPGISPYPLVWGGGPTPRDRGPIICSRQPSSLAKRNSIGAMSGSYSVYRALTIGMGLLPVDFRPDYRDTEPPFEIGPFPQWFMDESTTNGQGKIPMPKIVSIDPWGAVAQTVWAKEYSAGLDIRPTISQTKAHIKIPEIDLAVKEGRLKVDGKIVIKSRELPAFPGVDQGVEVNTFKAAIDPVWYLPGVAKRLGMTENLLRRVLFEETGGMYPELLTRPDLVTFLPPIGGCTVYIFGDPAYLSDESKELTFRPHDECNGSDVFGSDICTCRPYLTFGIEEAIKTAQKGGVGCIIYFKKEGRALGEVTKYLVYNVRKRGGDSASKYFSSTEVIAGVKDQRYQALALPDTLAWLGITKIDNLISMSDMKHTAIIESGVKVINRYEIPEELIPPDGMVEISAKKAAGYFSAGKQVTVDDLDLTHGRGWEDIPH